MTKIAWDVPSERFFETGVDRGVLYVGDLVGVAWNGLSTVTEAPSGGQSQAYYIDGYKYLNVPDDEEFEATIEAFMYPDNFALCDGSAEPYTGLFLTQQRRRSFGLSYRTLVGNGIDARPSAYKIHIIYNAKAEPSQKANKTVAEQTELVNFSWKLTALPPTISGYKRTPHIVIDTRTASPITVAALEDILYGTDSNSPRLPTIDEIFAAFDANSTFVVVDNGDGTGTITGTELEVHVTGDPTVYTIESPGAVALDADTYRLTSH